MGNLKIVHKSTHTINEEGVVKNSSYESIRVENHEHFAKLFTDRSRLLLSKQLAPMSLRLFLYILSNACYSTNIVTLTNAKREEFLRAVSSKNKRSLSNALTQLKKANLIIQKEKMVYVINPSIAYRGKEAERRKLLDELSKI